MLNLSKKYTCPYCGTTDNPSTFLIKKKSGGYNRIYVKCLNCGEKMRRNTLFASMSYYEWGLWLYLNIRRYNSPNYKFYDKVHFKELFNNLELMGKLYKREFQKGWAYGKENYNINGEYLLDELNKKYEIDYNKTPLTRLNDFI